MANENNGLGQIQRNTSLDMFDLANAEKMKAKEMQFQNEAMKARAEQQNLQAERTAMIDNQILGALKNGQLTEQDAIAIFQDQRIGDSTKQAVADVFYPAQATKELSTEDRDFYAEDGVKIPDTYRATDYEKQDQINAKSRGLGKVASMNANWQ